jgi:uridine kinase
MFSQAPIKPFMIGVAGGSGSGKTTIVKNLFKQLKGQQVTCISHDNYYKDLSHLTLAERKEINFDHPHSLDTALFVNHLTQLKAGQAIEMPTYSFEEFTRLEPTETVHPTQVIIVEGILVLDDKNLREQFDLKIFVDTDADIRLIRKLERDIKERGRTAEYVIYQYLTFTRPMHLEFVEPSKRYADIILPEGGDNTAALDLLQARIRELINKH